MEMQSNRGKALSLALSAMLVATLSVPMVAFADEQEASLGSSSASDAAAAVDATPAAEGAIVYEGVTYATLAEAFAAAKAGGTITLKDNVTVTGTTDADANDLTGDVVLDLAGHTVYGANNNIALRVKNAQGGSLTIKNGSIVAQDGTFCTVGASNAPLTLEGVNLKNSTAFGMSVKAFEGGRIVLKNCSSESTVGGGVAAAGGTVDLYDCSFTQKGYYDWNSCLLSASNGTGVVNVYGGTYTGENYGLYIFSSGGDINFYNGDLKVTGDKPALKGDLDLGSYPEGEGAIKVYGGSVDGSIAVDKNLDVVISGGSFTQKPADEYLAPGMTFDDATGTVVVDKAASVATVTKDGAVVGAYATLSEAVAAAADGGVVTLLTSLGPDQVSAGKDKYISIDQAGANVIIDLNQNKVELDSMDTVSVSAADVTLVVKNGTIVNTNKDSYGLYTYTGADNADITFENLVLDTVDQAIGVQGLNSNQNVTLKGCTITSKVLGAYWPPKSGTLTIEDTSITAPSAVTVKGGNVVVKGDSHIKAYGEKVVPEDYYNGTPGGKLTSTGAAIYVESGYNDRDIVLDIQGGTFESENGVTVLYFQKEGESATVDRDIAISGGTFIGEAPAPEFIVPGAGLQTDENGNLVTVSAKLVANSDKVVDGVHSYDVKNGAVDAAYLLGLMGMNVDPEKSGYELAVDQTNLEALNKAIAAKDLSATFDFTYTASKVAAEVITLTADQVDPVTVTVKLVDAPLAPGEGSGDASVDKPASDNAVLAATGDNTMLVVGAVVAVAAAALIVAAVAMIARRKQH